MDFPMDCCGFLQPGAGADDELRGPGGGQWGGGEVVGPGGGRDVGIHPGPVLPVAGRRMCAFFWPKKREGVNDGR